MILPELRLIDLRELEKSQELRIQLIKDFLDEKPNHFVKVSMIMLSINSFKQEDQRESLKYQLDHNERLLNLIRMVIKEKSK